MSDSQVLYVGPIANTKNQLLIASSDYKGDDADYYCTGVNDQNIINVAIDYLVANYNGGIVYLTPGIFYLSNSIYIKSYITITGSFQTILKDTFVNNSNMYIRSYGSSGSPILKVKISNLYFDIDNSTLGYYAIYGEYTEGIIIENNIFNLPTFYAIVMKSNSKYVNIYNNYFYFTYSNPSDTITPIGIYMTTVSYGNINTNYIYSDSSSDYYTFSAIRSALCNYITVNFNHIYNFTKSNMPIMIRDYQGGYNKYIGNNIYNILGHGAYTVPTATSIGISLGSCSYNSIIDNYIADAGQYGICNYDSLYTQVSNNIVRNCGNFMYYPGCESSTTSPVIYGEDAPTASNATFAFTSTGPYEGSGQYRFSKTVAAGTKAYIHLVDNVGAADVHGLVVGTQYEFNGWFKCANSASGGYQGLRFYQVTTAAGATSATVVTVATASWQQIAITATIYANATTAYIGIWASASLASTHTFDVDNLRLFQPGVGNAHNHNFYDTGTNTSSVNSWI